MKFGNVTPLFLKKYKELSPQRELKITFVLITLHNPQATKPYRGQWMFVITLPFYFD